ncbi:phospho-sugar mutase [uncultured Amnibacterium sp.]|uniref:phospho-sugar mutase n=1 Tax=uncultured Amnibacterium sp. TaxID=1631851 RepID=UPI0035CC785C
MTSAAEAARAWAAIDPDEATRAEVQHLLDLGDDAGLADRFGARLRFGTAGLRGALGAGPNRMNRVVVAQTSAGLARFLLGRTDAPTAVVGYDARHNSAIFARDAAQVLAAAGIAVTLLPRAMPTPVLAFAVRDLGVDAGVMITASHNPAADNGYKLYLGGPDEGSQLVPPADEQVLAAIDQVVAGGVLPPRSDQVTVAGGDLVERYIAAAAGVARAAGAAPSDSGTGDDPAAPPLRWVYTPMHGVGLATMLAVAATAGLPTPEIVPQQAQPDPDFPTVAFPNPEEPGALDLALARAAEVDADLLIANDPDADRLAVAVPEQAGWRRLTGNEVGLLLAWSTASRAASAGGAAGVLATSVVSTPGLAAIAEHFALPSAETLTGFKWISRVPGLVFGFEEALGYLVNPGSIRDKDGLSAAVAVLAEAIALRARGRTLTDRLLEIDAAIGHFASDQVSIRALDPAAIERTMAALRATPPTRLGGLAVLGIDDLAAGGPLPPTDGLRLHLEQEARVVIRPSGTEPKVKAYLDLVIRGDPDPHVGAAARLRTLAADVRRLLAG